MDTDETKQLTVTPASAIRIESDEAAFLAAIRDDDGDLIGMEIFDWVRSGQTELTALDEWEIGKLQAYCTEAIRNDYAVDADIARQIMDVFEPLSEPKKSEPMKSRQVVARCAADIPMKKPRWLWDMRMPNNGITLLSGREGIGKSTISYDIIAKITTGKLDGCHHGTPHGVGIIAGEDDWSAVIVPRLVAAGADLSRVHQLEAREDGERSDISAPTDLNRLKSVCQEKDIVLLVLDPIMSVIDGKLDTHKDADVRKALEPLSRFCAENDIAVLALIHVNKSATTDPLNSIMASRAFGAVARSVLYCITDPEQEDRYLFGHPKSNLGPKQPTIGYSITEYRIDMEPGNPLTDTIRTSRIRWGDIDTRSLSEVMGEQNTPRPMGELSNNLIEWITGEERAVTLGEIRDQFPDTNVTTLKSNLQRLIKKGKLARPGNVNGIYIAVKPTDADASD